MICTAMHSVPSRLSDNDARTRMPLSVAFTKSKSAYRKELTSMQFVPDLHTTSLEFHNISLILYQASYTKLEGNKTSYKNKRNKQKAREEIESMKSRRRKDCIHERTYVITSFAAYDGDVHV